MDTSGKSGNVSSKKLPDGVQILEFAKHRAAELACLTEWIEGSGGGGHKRAFQQLPRHMRRRAMSHNSKRIPRRLREIHKREIEKVGVKTSKRPSRKHRRRPSNLLQEYNRRQRKFIWLETHIWHAKRFKMSSQWGYKIPVHPNDKSVRACHRAASQFALLQDLSYYCCIELMGSKSEMLNVLKTMVSSECGLTFASKMYTSGSREGHALMYKCQAYPYGFLCPVTFLWRQDAHVQDVPNGDLPSSESACLWIFVHPASFSDLLDELVSGFALKKNTANSEVDKEKEEPAQKSELLAKKKFSKLSPKLKPFYERRPIYTNSHLQLTVLKDTLVRLRLIGNLSTAILVNVLEAVQIPDNHSDDVNSATKNAESVPWWDRQTAPIKEVIRQQSKMWNELKSCPFSNHFPPSSVICLTVYDPRKSLPISKTKSFPNISDTLNPTLGCELPPHVSYSSLWNRDIRDGVTFTKMSDHDMNKLRAQIRIPGAPLELGHKQSQIPIILIHQPGYREDQLEKSGAIGQGWDLILPAGWAMAFWIPLVYHGARVGGYREHGFVTHECRSLHFPDDFPDAVACTRLENQQSLELTEKHLKYPPDKRPNFIKLNVASPFAFPWRNLVLGWLQLLPPSQRPSAADANDPAVTYFVLRNKNILRRLQQQTLPTCKRARTEPTGGGESVEGIDPALLQKYWNSLVAVRLQMRSRGTLDRFSVVSQANADDLRKLRRDKNYAGPSEPPLKDGLRKVRRKIKHLKKTKPSNPVEAEMQEKLCNKPSDPQLVLQNLYLPSVENVATHCSRPVMGYCKTGGFSFSTSKVTGVAFLSFIALLKMLKEGTAEGGQSVVLVRSPHSLQYRFADVSLL